MNFPSINPTKTKAWKKLQQHFSDMKNVHMMDLFNADPARVNQMKINWNDFQVDFSKNRITNKTLSLLFELAEEVKLKEIKKELQAPMKSLPSSSRKTKVSSSDPQKSESRPPLDHKTQTT